MRLLAMKSTKNPSVQDALRLIYHPSLPLWLLMVCYCHAFPFLGYYGVRSNGNSFLTQNSFAVIITNVGMRRKKIENDWDDIFTEENNEKSAYRKVRYKDEDTRDANSNKLKTRSTRDGTKRVATKSTMSQDSYNNTTNNIQEEPLRTTLPGGQSLLFEMARKLFVWDNMFNENQEYDGKSIARSMHQREKDGNIALPRWRPYEGVSNENLEFRSAPPRMTSEGYARSIRRHSRKKNQPSMWMHALRIYKKTCDLEGRNSNTTTSSSTAEGFVRTVAHYEGALVACSKLGFWKEAFHIFQDAKQNQRITDGMVLSLLRACIRASYDNKNASSSMPKSTNKTTAASTRREPLDSAKDLLLRLEEEYGIFLSPLHVNPLAAAYQAIGDYNESDTLIRTFLPDKSEDEKQQLDQTYCASKDYVSYSLLVKSRVANGEWSNAVDALKSMTEAGIYPVNRDLNSWKEINSSTRSSSWKRRRKKYAS